MAHFSVAKAKDGLSSLIARAEAGEEVVITRHGKPSVKLVRADQPRQMSGPGTLDWLIARRKSRPGVGITSSQLMKLLDEDEGG
ncbi:MAG TPA: type II toxin-antitoxin system Phd/YefM family antitoxin [Allosphingosinicella sp.]